MHNQTEAKGERLRDKFVEVLKNGAFLKLTNNPFAYKLNKNLVTFFDKPISTISFYEAPPN